MFDPSVEHEKSPDEEAVTVAPCCGLVCTFQSDRITCLSTSRIRATPRSPLDDTGRSIAERADDLHELVDDLGLVGWAGISGLLPSASSPLRMISRMWSSVTLFCHALSV